MDLELVDYGTLELGTVDMSDYPDFVDAYIVYGEDVYGAPLPNDILDELNDDPELIASLIQEHFY